MAFFISSLTPGDDGYYTQNTNVEPIIWRNGRASFVNISNFFVQSNPTRLHLLDLSGNFRISS